MCLYFMKKKEVKSRFFSYMECSGIYFYFKKKKLEKSVFIMCESSKLAGSTFWKLFEVFILYAQ